jgi:hypothetical protein
MKKAPTKNTGVDKAVVDNNYGAYVDVLQKQINADIQAVKIGALDDEILRSRIYEGSPYSAMTTLTLWLCALSTGIVDNLEVIVSAGDQGPHLDFIPQWRSPGDNVKIPVLRLKIPGPVMQPSVSDHLVDPHEALPVAVNAPQR